MLSQAMTAALNEQLNHELYSSYLYLSMAAYFENLHLQGFANWMRVQYQEETLHALKILDFIGERGGAVKLMQIATPTGEWASPLAVMAHTLEHEQGVSRKINKLVDVAIKESDHATNNFLQWFVSEQVEEESSVDAILQQLKLTGDSGQGLLMIDRELAQRPQLSMVDPAAKGGA